MSSLRVDSVDIAFPTPEGGVLQVLDAVSFTVASGSFTTLVGPSGCGKSTLLQVMAGLIRAGSGSVSLNDVPFSSPPRDVLYVFQQYARSLMPWLSVRDNVAFGLRHREDLDREALLARCNRYIDLVGLSGFESYYPKQLSGGMQQRVAIARALACHPRVLLMDEPFSSVDAITRTTLQDQLLRIWRQLGITIVFVTHDIEEAIYLGQRVMVLGGRPAALLRDVSIELPAERSQFATREDPRYLGYRHDLLSAILGAAETGPAP